MRVSRCSFLASQVIIFLVAAMGPRGITCLAAGNGTVSPIAQTASDSAESSLQTGWDRFNRREYEAAIAAFQHATTIKPDLAPAYFGLALSLANLGRHQEALEYFKRTTELRP